MPKDNAFNNIREQMRIILNENPQGMWRKTLKKEICEVLGEKYAGATVYAQMNKIVKKTEEFEKSRIKGEGVWYFLKDIQQSGSQVDTPSSKQNSKVEIKEEDLYKPFADYLMSSDDDSETLSECTEAVPLGGNVFKDFWATPDVIGLYKPQMADVIQFPTEVVSAEIKLEDSNQALMTAFGQACSYRLFSHKTYLVVPDRDNIARLKTLCRVLGIGLVFFDSKVEKVDASIFKTELLARKHEPDMFYVNQYLKQVAKKFK